MCRYFDTELDRYFSSLFQNAFIAAMALLAPVVFAEKLPGRYIVELTTEPVSEHVTRLSGRGGMQGTMAAAHRSRVRGEQQQLRTRLEQRQAVVLASVDTVANAMVVQVSEQAAAQLASVPGVKRVVPVRRLHMLLDRAVMLHKVPGAWSEIGIDRAGAGVKIAIIDSGIDSSNPGFQDSSLTPPDSFPHVNSDSDRAYTNAKIIVARSYVSLLPNRDPDLSARDHIGHGTALAMIAAGITNPGPLATIAGVAPKAFLGNYKVFGTPGFNDSTSDDALLKAIDDAVADGMDIINLSLGDDLAPRLADDMDVQAVERASKAGVIVVIAGGNNGPDLSTISSPATAPSAIAVGASTNDRTFGTTAEVTGLSPITAVIGDGSLPSSPVTAPIKDVAALDGSGLACSSLKANSLTNQVALILRGTCTFETKLNNAQSAGAVAALVYAAENSPDPIPMAVGAASLPAEMIGYTDGVAVKQSIAAGPSVSATLHFTLSAVSIAANRLTNFSAAGPNVDSGIKPDVMAVGSDIYVATQTLDSAGEMYDPSGFVLVDGTSFSTPLVAGAAALLKSARPGLSVDQYRSLLINSAAAVQTKSGQTLSVQQIGAGILDVTAALHSTITAYPTSLSFGAGTSDAQVSRMLTITNVGASDDTYAIAPNRNGAAGSSIAAINPIHLAAGASMDVPIVWNASGLAPGPYEGSLSITAASSGTQTNIPYWYAVASTTPAHITILSSITSARRRSIQTDAILFRITDAAGLPLAGAQPQATAVSGGGTVRSLVSHDDEVPGMFGINVQMGTAAGTNLFRVQIGDLTADVPISGQ